MIAYMVTNKINFKVYIGQTIREMEKRKYYHLFEARRGSNLRFHRAIRKHGEENFTWEVIYIATSLQDLNEAEEYLIAEYDSRVKGYNVAYGGGNRRCAESTKRKLSEIHRGRIFTIDHRKRLSEGARRKVFTVAHRESMSRTATGKRSGEKHPLYGKKHSEETRMKMSEKRNENPCCDPEIYAFRHPNYGLAFCPKYTLRKEFSLNASDLGKMVAGKRKSVKGWSLASPEYLRKLREGMGEIVNEC